MAKYKPLYEDSLKYAASHNEKELWQESCQANCECVRAIEQIILENYNGKSLRDNLADMDAFRMLWPSELSQENKEQKAWLEEISRNLAPFEFSYRDGRYRLFLPLNSKVDSPFWISCDENGLDEGTGYDWARIFTEFFQGDPGFLQIQMEPEWGQFCAASKNPRLLESMGYAFKKLWENAQGFWEVAERVQSKIQEDMSMCF